MTTYNTGNPVGSAAAEDLYDNAKNLDVAVNGDGKVWVDRLGRTRVSMKAVEEAGPDAIAARDAAQAAAAIAQLVANATPYRTKAAMDSAPPIQDAWAAVIDDPDDKKNGYYVGRDNLWVWSALQPVHDVDVKALQDLISPADSAGRAFDFVDLFDRIIATLFADGTFATRYLRLQGSDLPVEGGAMGLAVRDVYGMLPVFFDADRSNLYGLAMEPLPGNTLAVADRHGFLMFYAGSAGVHGGRKAKAVSADARVLDLGAQLRTDVMHVLCYGQSLSRGNSALPALSTAQPYQNVMLAGGVKARPGDGAYSAAAMVPLVEAAVASEGETPVSGCLNGVVRRAVEAGSDAGRWVFLGSSSGQGGRTVEQLAPGGSSGRFTQTVQIVKDAKALCDAEGKSYSVWGMTWYQGENDYNEASSDRWPYDYTERWLAKLWASLKREIVAVTGQAFAPYLFTYQVAAHRRYVSDTMPIALAHWRSSRMFDDVVLAAPCYIFPTVADNLHLTNEASWLMGEYTARAMYQTMVARHGKWRPLEPVDVNWQAEQIKVKFHVPAGQIAIDDALAATYDNAGFILRTAADAVIDGGITGVAVTGVDEITITTAPGIPVDATLTYARGKPGDPAHSGPATGARGNVRDTAGLYDKAISPLGNQFALHNACVMFEYSRKNGF